MSISVPNLRLAIPIYQAAIDSIIDDLGKDVKLYFTQIVENVNSEFYDPIRPGGILKPDFKTTSSNPSPTKTTTTKTIKALIQYNPKDFEKFNLKIDDPKGILRLKTYMYEIPDIKRCDYVVPDVAVKDISEVRYKLLREPITIGLGEQRYAISYWERV